MQEELELKNLQAEYREKDSRGIPMSIRKCYRKKLNSLKQRVRGKDHEKQLGQVMLDKKLISSEELKRTLAEQKEFRQNKLLGEILLDKGVITEKELGKALKEQSGEETAFQNGQNKTTLINCF